MTDKEIIIDCVDVSKCRWHTNLIMDCLEIPTQPCKCTNDKNCYYKQLKHKEQECEELKEKIKKYSKINEQDTRDFAKLKQECKNLEEELRGCRIGIKDISIENTEICKISEKYKRVLDEIEKFAQDIANTKEWINCTYNALKAESILDIISKAKEGNNNG